MYIRRLAAVIIMVCTTGITGVLQAQDIRDVLRDFDRGRLERVRAALPALEARYYDAPEFLFLKAVFEEDADRAFALYQQINETAPDNPIFERALWRMCQYNYAKGLYKTCYDMVIRFRRVFPRSRFSDSAKEMQQRVEDKLENEPEAVLPPPEPHTKYTIQIVAFSSRTNAQRGLNSLQKRGLTGALIKEQQVGGRKLYKIWVGEFSTREEAQKAGNEYQQKYNFSSFTIVEVKQ